MNCINKIDYEQEVARLARKIEITDLFEEIELDLPFDVMVWGDKSDASITVYAPDGSTAEDHRHYRKVFNKAFDGDIVWSRDFSKYSGRFTWNGRVEDWRISIQNAPMGKCKVIKREVTSVVYEADCSEEATDEQTHVD